MDNPRHQAWQERIPWGIGACVRWLTRSKFCSRSGCFTKQAAIYDPVTCDSGRGRAWTKLRCNTRAAVVEQRRLGAWQVAVWRLLLSWLSHHLLCLCLS